MNYVHREMLLWLLAQVDTDKLRNLVEQSIPSLVQKAGLPHTSYHVGTIEVSEDGSSIQAWLTRVSSCGCCDEHVNLEFPPEVLFSADWPCEVRVS